MASIVLLGQPLGQRGGLGVAEVGAAPGRRDRRRPLVDAHRQRVADEQQLHGSSVLACAAVADLFVAEQPGPPGAPRVVLVHGSLDRSTAFLRVARELRDLTRAPLRPARLRQVARGGAGGDLRRPGGRPRLGGGRRARHRRRPQPRRRGGAHVRQPPSGAGAGRRRLRGADAVAHVVAVEHRGRRGAGRVRRRGESGRALHAPHRRATTAGRSCRSARKAQRRAEGPALVAELRSLRPPHPAPYDLATFPVPVVAGHGGESRPHHQEAARTLADQVPRGELVVIEGASHGAHLSHPRSSPSSSGARWRSRDPRESSRSGSQSGTERSWPAIWHSQVRRRP